MPFFRPAPRLCERLVGTVGWSHSERAYDGVAAAWDVEGVQLYGFAARPTTGVFEVEHAYSHLSDITVGGVTATLRRGTFSEHVEVGVFGLGYGDDRPVGDGGLPDPIEVGTLGENRVEMSVVVFELVDVLVAQTELFGSSEDPAFLPSHMWDEQLLESAHTTGHGLGARPDLGQHRVGELDDGVVLGAELGDLRVRPASAVLTHWRS